MKPALKQIMSVMGDGITVNDCIAATGLNRGIVEATLYEMFLCGMASRERIGHAYRYTVANLDAKHKHRNKRVNGRTAQGKARIAEILALLSDRPKGKREIARLVGASTVTIYQYLLMLKLDKRIYVAEWDRNKYQLYLAGSLPDAKKKPRQSQKQISDRYRRKKKNDPEYHIRNLMRCRAHRLKTRQAKPDPFLAQFNGLFRRAA